MNMDFAKKLGLWVYNTKVNTYKIDGLKLDIFGIVIASFLMEDKEVKSRFFEETFLMTDISIDIALGMPFLILNNLKIDVINCHIY